MKTWIARSMSCLWVAGVVIAAGAQTQAPPPVLPDGPAVLLQEPPGMPELPAAAAPEAPAATPAPAVAPEVAELPAASTNADALRLNFRAAPIDLVLNYLSDAAGFIIQVNTPVTGKLDVWSNQPVTRDEAVALLNAALNRNGYAAVRNGRTLTVMSKDDAMHGDIPVKVSDDPASIPKNDEIVTQIIPIRFVEAVQLAKDLAPMVSAHATVIANEAGNSIVVTDTQASIRHLAEIIKAIDSSAENMTEVRVFRLKHHDPTEVASMLTSLLADQSNTGGNQVPMMLGGFFGRGGPPRGGNGAAGGAANNAQERIKKQQQVVAVADPRTSAVVVKAAKDLMEQIAGMIAELDQESPGKMQQVSVFHLENADPQQVQQVLQDMFQSSTSQRSSSSSQVSPLQSRIQQSQNSSTLGGSSSGLSAGLGGASRSGSGLPSSF